MIFNKEKILYWAKSKGLFNVKLSEFSRKTDCAKIIKLLLSSGFLRLDSDNNQSRFYSITPKGEVELKRYQNEYQSSKSKNKILKTKDLCSFLDDKATTRVYSVYKGMNKTSGKIIYIGTTVQLPRNRFRWHKSNGKDLNFKVIHEFNNSEDMLNKEFELIKALKPKLNKITSRPQNLNVKLTKLELDKRLDDKEWCQSCFRRRAKNGSFCGYC